MSSAPRGAHRRLSHWRGCFKSAADEAQFREAAWPEWSGRARAVFLITAVFFQLFLVVDFLALGWRLEFAVTAALKLGFLALALWVVRSCRGPARPERLDRRSLLALLFLSTTQFWDMSVQQNGLMYEAPSGVMMALGYYLFVPARFPVLVQSSLFGSLGFILVGALSLQPTTRELALTALQLAICNLLGGWSALHTQILQRREYLGRAEARMRAHIEERVARLSTQFLSPTEAKLDGAIAEALGEIGQLAGADHAYVIEFEGGGCFKSCAYAWSRPGFGGSGSRSRMPPLTAVQWQSERVLRGEIVQLSDLSELSQDSPLRREFQEEGLKSVLLVPLRLGQRTLGCLAFVTTAEECSWSSQDVNLLRLVADMIANIQERKRVDRTQREQACLLEASNEALARSNAELQRFAYVCSHDLKEPLRSIAGYSGLLSRRYRGKLDAQADEFIDFLSGAARRSEDMIDALLAYARADLRARPFEVCATHEVVQGALANLDTTLKELDASVDIGYLPKLIGDRGQLLQLFQNLIGNALKFHGDLAPRVFVGSKRADSAWEFEVTDNGIGIEAALVPKLFQMFSRLHHSDRYPGQGIGLATCKRIVERHGGRIWVQPNELRGSVFRFTLPAAASPGLS